ncbi:hypothetical protein K450DRAFT_244364 [Umbelopsis ramanniana AG]|uniref:Uncharacterized protein n=1 Tax=Umbelopsis ramanniana AG TaxID=1314678 RepID=A0AAD5HC89_UMBRA|nr:uncharacterized protein K450DRAFT_244364 [Umbelopsis ramanniana AG]KAI8578970.1 hypothetical protein K450DRAFT_244364 [Umbelopsis ramanniana AG]
MESRKRRNFSSYQSKAPPFAIRQPGNEPYSPPRTTTTYESHVFSSNNDTVNNTVTDAAFQSPLNDSIISNSFHGFTSPASRASLNSNYFRRRSHRRYSPPSYYKSPSRFNIRPLDADRSPSPPPEHSISVPVMIPIPETTPSRVQTMISRFQTAVDYGISPSLFPEPEDDTYDFFEKIETPEGPRVIDARKRAMSTTSNISQKRRKLQVDSSSRFSSRASLHIQPPSFLPRTSAAPPPVYIPLPARSPTPVRRPPPTHVAPPSHSPTPVRVLRDISDYTKYGETLLDRPQELETEQPIDVQDDEEDIPSPVFSLSPEASPPPPIHRPPPARSPSPGASPPPAIHRPSPARSPSPEASSPPPIHRPPPARSPPHDRVLRDITRPKDRVVTIAEDTDSTFSHVGQKRVGAAPVEIDEEETEKDVLHFVKKVAEGATFENDITSRASSFIEKELILPSQTNGDSQNEVAAPEKQTSNPMFDQDAKQALDRLLMEQDQEDQAQDELIQEKENFVPAGNTDVQKDAFETRSINPDLEEAQPADEEEEEIITTIFDDDEREMDMLFLDEVDDMPLHYKQDEDSQLPSPIEKRTAPLPELDEQPHIEEAEVEEEVEEVVEEEIESDIEEVDEIESEEDIEEVQPRRSSTPLRILEPIFEHKDDEKIIAEESDVASDLEDMTKAGEMDDTISDEGRGIEVDLSVAAEEDYATKQQDEETSQILSPVEKESNLPPLSPVAAVEKHDTVTIERRESYRVSEHEEEQTLDQVLMDHRRDHHTPDDYNDYDHFEGDDEDDIPVDHVPEFTIQNEHPSEEHHQGEPIENEGISEEHLIVKEHTHVQYETVDQGVEVNENDEEEANISMSPNVQPVKEAELPATIVDEEERNLDMTLFEEVEGLNDTPHHDDEDSQPRSPLEDQRKFSLEAYHQEYKEKTQERPSPSPSTDPEEHALDRLLLEEVDAFGSAESIVSIEKENKAFASPEPSFYAARTPSPVQELRYHERLQSGYSGQPRSALEVIRDTLSQNQLPTPPRSSPNVSVTKGQDVLLKKMETTDLNRSFAQLHASYTSTRQNRAEPRREANEMDVVSEAIGQVMAPYHTSEHDSTVKTALKKFRRSMFEQLSQQATLYSEHEQMQLKLRQTKNHNKQLRAQLLEIRRQRHGVKASLQHERNLSTVERSID